MKRKGKPVENVMFRIIYRFESKIRSEFLGSKLLSVLCKKKFLLDLDQRGVLLVPLNLFVASSHDVKEVSLTPKQKVKQKI